MATDSTPPPPPLNPDHHRTPRPPPETTLIKQEPQDLTTTTNNSPAPINLINSISNLRNLSTALSTFQRRYDELQQHLDFIQTTINSKLPNPLSIHPITHTQSPTSYPSKSPTPNFPNSQQKPSTPTISANTANLDKNSVKSPAPKFPNSSTKLLNSEQNPNNNNTSSTSTINSKLHNDQLAKAETPSRNSEQKLDTKLPNSSEQKTNDAESTRSELEELCFTMCGRGLRKYFISHLSNLNKLRDEAPKALKCARDPAKLVLECFGRFFLQGIKAYNKGSPMIPAREASIFALECFLLMGIDGVAIENSVKKEAETAAIEWRKRLMSEGRLAKACEIDARGLLLLISCFGIPRMFKSEDVRDLIQTSNARKFSGALRRSSVLLARIPEIIEGMVKNKMEIEAVDVVYTFEVQDRFPPQTILTSFLSKSKEIWKRKRKAAEGSFASVNEANKKQLADLKSLIKCLKDHKIDPSKSFPEREINENISSLEKEIADLDKKVKENVMLKRKADEVESSQRLKTQEVKRSRFAGHVPQQQKVAGQADEKSSYGGYTQMNFLQEGILGHNSYTASPSVPHGSGAGLLHEYAAVTMAGSSVPHGSGAGLLHDYADVTMAGSGVGLAAAGLGGGSAGGGSFLPTGPYAGVHRGMLVDTVEHMVNYYGHSYGWRGEAASNERLVSHTFAGQPSSVGYNGLYRPSQSLEGFAGLPDHPSVAVSSRSTASDLYQFADAVLDSESYHNSGSHPGGTLPPVVPSHHNSSYLY